MIKLENVSKTYHSKSCLVNALENVNIEVSKGSSLLLMGASGTGKTTILNIIGCLVRPTAGRVLIDGKNVSRLPEHFLCSVRRKNIGFIFQQFNLIPGHTLLDNIVLPLLPMGVSPRKRDKIAIEKLSILSLEHKKDFDVGELSGGEQQRAAIARALINNPDIILADEPTSNVDSKNAEFIIALFDKFKKEGKTIIISSHDPRVVESNLADQVLFLEQNISEEG